MNNTIDIMSALLKAKRPTKIIKENKVVKVEQVDKNELKTEKVKVVKEELSRRDMFLLNSKIAKRADELGLLDFDRMSLMMDLEIAYEQYNLKLQELLDADNDNFSHDIIGIQNHIDRTNKTINPTFVPRYANEVKTEEQGTPLNIKTDFLIDNDSAILFYAKGREFPDKTNGQYYQFINYFDVYGNKAEGFEVNDSYIIGNVFIPLKATNKDIINFLGDNQYILHNPLLFDIEELGESFDIVNKSTREPLFGFNPVYKTDEVIAENIIEESKIVKEDDNSEAKLIIKPICNYWYEYDDEDYINNLKSCYLAKDIWKDEPYEIIYKTVKKDKIFEQIKNEIDEIINNAGIKLKKIFIMNKEAVTEFKNVLAIDFSDEDNSCVSTYAIFINNRQISNKALQSIIDTIK